MDNLMKLTLVLMLTFSGMSLLSILYYAANYSEEWRSTEYSDYVNTMNKIASPIAFFVIVLIPICTLKRVRRNVAPFGLVIAGIALALISIDYKLALSFASVISLAFLVAYLSRNLASTLIHSGVALFILDFALFDGDLHLFLFYVSSFLYLTGLVLRFYSLPLK